jgi:hypothetical protein
MINQKLTQCVLNPKTDLDPQKAWYTQKTYVVLPRAENVVLFKQGCSLLKCG